MEHINEKNRVALSIYKQIFERNKALTHSLGKALFSERQGYIGNLPYYPDGSVPSEYFTLISELAEKEKLDIEALHAAAFLAMLERMRALYEGYCFPEDFLEDAAKSVLSGEYDYRMKAKYLVGALFRIRGFDYQVCSNIYEGFEEPSLYEPILKLHIPRGARFDKESRYESYCSAYRFFSEKMGKKKLFLVCDSWLLSHEHKESFPETNIGSFADDFDVVKSYRQHGYEGAQRVFGKGFSQRFAELPEDTALRRFYKKKMLCGEPTYYGVGVKLMTEEEFGKD